ncbi:MAG: DUF3662 domain-containing protein [Peptococcaceae bacterium]|nr:DUF3662 domain-containing protein [Peptococcaceae bacterium]
MKLLSKCEDVAEVILTFLFKKNTESIQPVEVAKELLRAMQRNRQISISNVYVPNVYMVTLNPEDYKTITNFGQTFLTELSHHIFQEGSAQGYTFLTPPSISVREDNSLLLGRMKLDVAFDDQAVANWQPEEREDCFDVSLVEKTSVMSHERSMIRTDDPGYGRKIVVNHEIDAYLEFVEGSHIGKVYHLVQDAVVVGRQQACDLALRDDEVSRQHLNVFREGLRWCIEDLGSTNGTFVNGVRVDKYILKPQDRVRLGQTTFVFRMPEYQGK